MYSMLLSNFVFSGILFVPVNFRMTKY